MDKRKIVLLTTKKGVLLYEVFAGSTGAIMKFNRITGLFNDPGTFGVIFSNTLIPKSDIEIIKLVTLTRALELVEVAENYFKKYKKQLTALQNLRKGSFSICE